MAKKKITKIFVLDTNVLLHDRNCLSAFEENNVVLPITTIEELDNFKKGQEERNVNARTITRKIAAIIAGKSPTSWVSRGECLGDFKITLNTAPPEKSEFNLNLEIPDHRILAAALKEKELEESGEKREVIFVTKDSNLRIKAQAYGLKAQDYLADYVEVQDVIEYSATIIEDEISEFITELYTRAKRDKSKVSIESLQSKKPDKLTEGYFILRSGKNNALVFATKETVEILEKTQTSGITPKNSEQIFAMHALTDYSKCLIALTGKAGTGKTLLALAAALAGCRDGKTDSILLARPIVAMSNKDLGFLPGDVNEKIGPYMQPLFDNLGVIKKAVGSRVSSSIDEMQKDGRLEILPLAYVRGRSISSVTFIVDEAQNLTPHEIKTIVTRAGEGTRIIFTGDIRQIDNNYLSESSNGLSHLIDKMKDQHFFSHVHLVKGERSELASVAADLL